MTEHENHRVVLVVTAAMTARLFIAGYANHLAQGRYDVSVVADGLTSSDRVHFDSRVKVYSVPMRRNPSLLNDLVSLARVASLLGKIRPDAAIYATPKAGLLTAVSSKLMRIPVRIYGLWGLRFETVSGIKKRLLTRLERMTASASTHVLANSPSLLDCAVAAGIGSKRSIRVLGSGSSHGVDLEKFSVLASVPPVDSLTADFLRAGRGPVLGYIGRVHPDKGIDTLMNAALHLGATGFPVRVLMVGSGEGADVWDLPVGSSAAVHATGHVEDVRPYLRQMDALVLMSRREGFPNVVIEAAAMSVPAIVADSTGTIDSVVDGKTGFVVPVGDSVRLAEVIREVAKDPEMLQRLGAGARERVEVEFGQEHIWKLHSDFLANALEGVRLK